MRVKDEFFGDCELEISHGRLSSVDSFVESAYSETLGRELLDFECDEIQRRWEAEIQEESYSGGYSRNHN